MGNQVSSNLKHALLLESYKKKNSKKQDSKINKSGICLEANDMEGMVKKMERYVNATSNLYSELEVLNELEQATKKFQQNQHEESQRAFEQKLMWQKQDVRHLKEVSLWNQTCDKVVELLARTVCTIYARISVVFGQSKLQKKGLGAAEGGCSSPPMKEECGEVSGHIGDLLSSQRVSGPLRRAVVKRSSDGCQSGSTERTMMERRETHIKPQIASRKGEVDLLFRNEDIVFPCGTSPGRLFLDCLSLSSSASKFDDDDGSCVVVDEDQRSQISRCYSVGNGSLKRAHPSPSSCSNPGVSFSEDQRNPSCGAMNNARFGPKSRLMVYAPPSTIGGSALALHYANVIIVIQKLLRYPHLVGEEARDDLYQMLPTSLRMSLRINLKSYVKNLAIYDAPLAHDWKDTLDGILRWLAPLAHNMIRWQSERNFEQHQIVKRTNVLLLQTLYFADRGKTEAAICELLVG
uniref:DUF668 domain-containing protein n=1 Tax=Salix viminalis TaxID=40686 RepID=A0A6N2LY17_SALVM